MLPELLELILLDVYIDTIKSFALSNKHFYQLISHPRWWSRRSIYHQLHMWTSVTMIEGCQNPVHQHYPSSNKNYTIQQWIDEYHVHLTAKKNAVNTFLVYDIELSMDSESVIHIYFKQKPLFEYWIEKRLCEVMSMKQVSRWISTSLKLDDQGYTIKCRCEPNEFSVRYTYESEEWKSCTMDWLTYCYVVDADILNIHNKPYMNNKIWKVADYFGKIKK